MFVKTTEQLPFQLQCASITCLNLMAHVILVYHSVSNHFKNKAPLNQPTKMQGK